MLTQHKTHIKYLSMNFLKLFTGTFVWVGLFGFFYSFDTLLLFIPFPSQALLLADNHFYLNYTVHVLNLQKMFLKSCYPQRLTTSLSDS